MVFFVKFCQMPPFQIFALKVDFESISKFSAFLETSLNSAPSSKIHLNSLPSAKLLQKQRLRQNVFNNNAFGDLNSPSAKIAFAKKRGKPFTSLKFDSYTTVKQMIRALQCGWISFQNSHAGLEKMY